MFALSGGELVMVLLIFALVWCSGALPRLGERVGVRFAKQRASSVKRDGG
jgi:Sec-independent protein translocase protein TatA